MTKTDLLKELKRQQQVQDKWLESLPRDIRIAFYDNAYVESLQKTNDMLIGAAFGDMIEDALWFLYDWKPAEWPFTDEAAFYTYFRKVCGE